MDITSSKVADFAIILAKKLMNVKIRVTILNNKDESRLASYGNNNLSLNNGRISDYFENFPSNMEAVIDLLIHEFGHHYSGDHLSREYNDALTMLGAKMTMLALKEPKIF